MDAVMFVHEDDSETVAVEFGGDGPAEVMVQFEAGLTVGINYGQAEMLWRELTPYFASPSADEEEVEVDGARAGILIPADAAAGYAMALRAVLDLGANAPLCRGHVEELYRLLLVGGEAAKGGRAMIRSATSSFAALETELVLRSLEGEINEALKCADIAKDTPREGWFEDKVKAARALHAKIKAAAVAGGEE